MIDENKEAKALEIAKHCGFISEIDYTKQLIENPTGKRIDIARREECYDSKFTGSIEKYMFIKFINSLIANDDLGEYL